MSSRRDEALQERVARERAAQRLAHAVPGLTTLRILIQERSGITKVEYRKRVMVQSAPALFFVDCGDERCRDGGHDITGVVMSALRARLTQARGDHVCDGSAGTAPCVRRIDFELLAEYEQAN